MARTPTSSTIDRPLAAESGFTLVELLVVLGLLAIVYAMVAPSLGRAIGSGELRVASHELVASLREARSAAIAGGREVRFIVDGSAGAYGAGQVRRPIPRGFDIAAEVPEARRLTPRIAAIDFFPDGASTGGQVVLAVRGGGARVAVDVDWLTGRVWPAE
ncbi:MAG: GspH/FimT family pseudopilin [Alphaproteobacteria bacterium]|nr:GspH/FimT family pseudopilin [Alphaproteobacteria bacterium]